MTAPYPIQSGRCTGAPPVLPPLTVLLPPSGGGSWDRGIPRPGAPHARFGLRPAKVHARNGAVNSLTALVHEPGILRYLGCPAGLG